MWDLYGKKNVSVKRIFTNKQDICHDILKSKRESMKRKHSDSAEKKKFCEQQSIKKVTLTVLWDMKGLY